MSDIICALNGTSGGVYSECEGVSVHDAACFVPLCALAVSAASAPNPRMKALEKRNAELQGELEEKNQWAERLENQATRLLADKKQLTTRLNALDSDFKALMKSKEQLATRTNDTINELRGYLVKYQEAVMEASGCCCEPAKEECECPPECHESNDTCCK